MSKYAKLQVKKLLENNHKAGKYSRYTLGVKVKGEFAETNWMTITHATAKILARLLN